MGVPLYVGVSKTRLMCAGGHDALTSLTQPLREYTLDTLH